MPNFSKVIRDSILEGLTIKPVDGIAQTNTLILGRIYKCDENFIYIRITDGFEEILLLNENENQLFDVVFYKNRTTYQLQHSALDRLKEHNLFQILINNAKYAQNEYYEEPNEQEQISR